VSLACYRLDGGTIIATEPATPASDPR
jgi:hypothetical protein